MMIIIIGTANPRVRSCENAESKLKEKQQLVIVVQTRKRRLDARSLLVPPLRPCCQTINVYIYIYITQQHQKSRPSLYITVHLHFALSALNAVFSVSANSDLTDSSSRLGSLPPFFSPLFLRLLGLRRSVCVTTFSSTLVLILSVTILTSSVHPFSFLSHHSSGSLPVNRPTHPVLFVLFVLFHYGKSEILTWPSRNSFAPHEFFLFWQKLTRRFYFLILCIFDIRKNFKEFIWLIKILSIWLIKMIRIFILR